VSTLPLGAGDPVDSTVTVPPGSASKDAVLTITETDPSVPPPPSGFELLGQIVGVSVDPPDTTFSLPVALVISYDQSIVEGVDEDSLEVFHATDSTWELVGPCSVPLSPDPCIADRDTLNNTITIMTTHFSLFGLGAPTAIQVQIDIMPNTFPNLINLKSKGVIPVAILSTSTFDATTVDPLTVCFGDANDPPPPYPSERDCTEAHGKGHISDVDGDGDKDLVLHFETKDTGIDPGDTQACLTGRTYGSTPIQVQGCDSIRTVPPSLSLAAAKEALTRFVWTWLISLGSEIRHFI
jgi:hypothetical protein